MANVKRFFFFFLAFTGFPTELISGIPPRSSLAAAQLLGSANVTRLTTKNGLKMPIVGLGTWRARDAELEAALHEALKAGYRLFDTATIYGNEKVIGKVLKEWLDSGKVKREDLFITTKLPLFGNRPEGVEKYLKKSLQDLQLDYVDLYLIHFPIGLPDNDGTNWLRDAEGKIILDKTTDHLAIWKAMEAAVKKGWTRHIGVSNFNSRQIQRILDNCTIKPSNQQIELHVLNQTPDLVKFCLDNDITVTSFSTLGSPGVDKVFGLKDVPDLLSIPEVVAIAKKHGKSPGHILLKLFVQKNIAVIPKSTNSDRLKQNLDLFNFELSPQEMKTLEGLNKDRKIMNLTQLLGSDDHPENPFK